MELGLRGDAQGDGFKDESRRRRGDHLEVHAEVLVVEDGLTGVVPPGRLVHFERPLRLALERDFHSRQVPCRQMRELDVRVREPNVAAQNADFGEVPVRKKQR